MLSSRRLMVCHVVVELESPIQNAISVFKTMSTMLTAAMKGFYDRSLEYEVAGFQLAADPTQQKERYFKTEFSIYHRDERPYSENRFFCTAPLPTDAHLEVLAELDKELRG
jgi:hypothetical protein